MMALVRRELTNSVVGRPAGNLIPMLFVQSTQGVYTRLGMLEAIRHDSPISLACWRGI